jgi:aspartate kinase
MKTLIMKFGGTSTGSREALHHAADIVCTEISEWEQIIVVISAMEGVTDMLLECAEYALTADQGKVQFIIEKIHQKLFSIVTEMFSGERPLLDLINNRITELTHICQCILDRGHTSPRELAQIAALGERINIHVFSAALRDRGLRSEPVDAADLILTDDCFCAATPIKEFTETRTKSRLSPLLAEGTIPVVTGFIGGTISGATTTLGRGGSDYTAAIVAESLAADEIWILTDVDGVMTADPSLVSRARLIPEISYTEVFQLAYSGADVLHPKTILPAKEANIPIIVKNTFNPACSGTRISHCSSSIRQTISSVTARFDVKTITFEIRAGVNIQQIKSQLVAALKNRETDIWAIFQSEQHRSVSFAVSAKNEVDAVQTAIDSGILQSYERTLPPPHVTNNLSLITLVGQDIYLSPQVQSSVFNTLDEAGVEIKQIGNGTSPDSLVFAVANQQIEYAINKIHDDVILSPHNQPVLRPNLAA